MHPLKEFMKRLEDKNIKKKTRERKKQNYHHRMLKGVKICRTCGREKSVSRFNHHPVTQDLLDPDCKECYKDRIYINKNNDKNGGKKSN